MLKNNKISIFKINCILHYILRSTIVLYYILNPSSQSFLENIELHLQELNENSSEKGHSMYFNECCSEIYNTGWGIFEDLWNLKTEDCHLEIEMNEYDDKTVTSEIKQTKYYSSKDHLEIFPIPTKCPKDIFYNNSSSSTPTLTKKRKIIDTLPDSNIYTYSTSTDSVCSETNSSVPNISKNIDKKKKIEKSKKHENDNSKLYKKSISLSITDTSEVCHKEDNVNSKEEKMNFHSNTRKKYSLYESKFYQKSTCARKYKYQGANDCRVSIGNRKAINQTDIINPDIEIPRIYEEVEYIPTIRSPRGNFPLSIEMDIFQSYIIKYVVKGREDEQIEDSNTLSREEDQNSPMITIIDITTSNNLNKIVYLIRNIPKYLTPVFPLNELTIQDNKLVATKLHNFVYDISLIVLYKSEYDVSITDLIPNLKYNTEKTFWRDNYIRRIYRWEYIVSNFTGALHSSDSELLVPDYNKTPNNTKTKNKKVSKQIRSFLGDRNYKANFFNYFSITQNSNISEILSKLSVFKEHIKYIEGIMNSPNNLKDTIKKICDFRMTFVNGKKKIQFDESLNDIEKEIVLVYEVIYNNFNKLSEALIFSYNMFLRDTEELKIYVYNI